MRRFVEGIDREQATLFPECLEDWIDRDNPVRAIDAFVDKLDLTGVGFDGVAPEATGRPSYHPSELLLKLYIYGYLNRVQSSRRLEREAGRNVEVTDWMRPAINALSDSNPKCVGRTQTIFTFAVIAVVLWSLACRIAAAR
jgi:Transposase domain (DUF772)